MSDRSVDINNLSIVVAHWHVESWGGAEYLVTHLADALGKNTIYTLGEPTPDDPNPYGDVDFEDVTWSLDYPRTRRLQRFAGRLFEYAQWEDVDWCTFGEPDILITSGATTRAVITPDDTFHINYCHSTPRWFYDLYHTRKRSNVGVLARPLIRYLRARDQAIDPRVDRYLVNSPVIKRRLWKYYKRDAEVLYPPINLERYHNECDDGFYLHLGRLDVEKGVPALVEAFVGSNHQLVLAGERGDINESVLRQIQMANEIRWRGFVEESEKYDLLARCRAVVFNGRNEDFGIVPIEANASGKSCLARDEGFPALFITDGDNGYLHNGTVEGIRSAIDRFESTGISGDPTEHTTMLSANRFAAKLKQALTNSYTSFSFDYDDV